ncbi:hypothetical protein ACPPVO_18960 [Dactylosporangium sp. McL0621]|uniref:hypothetical protein n=1 Tax=Dactylosporangium sp. McL0621 TaxID=3415678 RepID=UPI003CF3E14B
MSETHQEITASDRARHAEAPPAPHITEDRIAMTRAMGGSVPAQRKKPKKGRKK